MASLTKIKANKKGKIMQARLHVPTEKEKYRHTLHIPRRKSQINSLKKIHLTHKAALYIYDKYHNNIEVETDC